jgi:hypothetical protein
MDGAAGAPWGIDYANRGKRFTIAVIWMLTVADQKRVAIVVSGTFVGRMSDFVLETDTRTGIVNVHPTHSLTHKRPQT